LIALLFRVVLSAAARRARYTALTAFGTLITTARTSPPVMMPTTAYRPTPVAMTSMTVLAPTTTTSAAAATTAPSQVRNGA
jgi:hypothetical protein